MSKPNRKEIIAQLKEKHIVYGSKYTIQCAYLWEGEEDVAELKDKDPSSWSVCKNVQMDLYEDGTRFENCPVPIEIFEAGEMERAADRFIELEYGNKYPVLFVLLMGLGVLLLMFLLFTISIKCV